MNPTRFLPVVALASMLAGCATEPTTDHGRSMSDREIAQHISAANHLILQGIPDTAIRDHLDPVIQFYEHKYPRTGRSVYSARTMPESLMYAILDSVPEKPVDQGRGKARDIVVVSGGWTDALELKGYALFELKQYAEAEAALKEALALAPYFSTAWAELGNLYQSQRNWPDAMAAYKQAESAADIVKEDDPLRPLYLRALRGQAFVLTEQGQLDDSEALYHKCLAINPDDGGSKRELAYIAELRAKQAK